MLAVANEAVPSDIAYMRGYFRDSFGAGDRVILTTRGAGEDRGYDKIRAVCMGKDENNNIFDPVTFIDIHSNLIIC